MPKERDWHEQEILKILDLHENDGLSYTQIANRLGVTKGMIAGLIANIKRQLKATDPDGNQNGTMPRRWGKR